MPGRPETFVVRGHAELAACERIRKEVVRSETT